MIEVIDLTKRYGERVAVDHINFKIEAGEIVGLLGPNGAGKTTTMNMLTGYISTSEGQILIDGMDILDHPVETKRMIGYLPEHPPLYTDMVVKDYLSFVYELKKVKLDRKEHLTAVMNLVGIWDVKDRIIKNLSKGYQQRVGFAQALIGDPEILILDEPTVGLDPNQIIEIRNLISDLGKKHTVILSTHILPEVSAVCEKVIIINKGKIVAMDTTENLLRQAHHSDSILVRIEGVEEEVKEKLAGIEGIDRVALARPIDGTVFEYTLRLSQESEIRSNLSIELAKVGLSALMIKDADSTLEQVFAQFTTEEEKGENA